MQFTMTITGLDEVKKQLGSLAKQADYAASRALNTTAYAINAKLKTEMSATFKGGATAYTLRSFKVTQANKGNLVAQVGLRTDNPEKGTNFSQALAHLFTSGQRRYKNIEGWLLGRRLIPPGYTVAPGAAMPLDQYGNMRRAALTEVLGVIGTKMRNLRVFRRTGAGKAQKAVGYFVVLPGDKTRMHPGIYKRVETGTSSAILPMILYVKQTAYRQFIDLQKLGLEVATKTFQPAFDSELSKALANAK